MTTANLLDLDLRSTTANLLDLDLRSDSAPPPTGITAPPFIDIQFMSPVSSLAASKKTSNIYNASMVDNLDSELLGMFYAAGPSSVIPSNIHPFNSIGTDLLSGDLLDTHVSNGNVIVPVPLKMDLFSDLHAVNTSLSNFSNIRLFSGMHIINKSSFEEIDLLNDLDTVKSPAPLKVDLLTDMNCVNKGCDIVWNSTNMESRTAEKEVIDVDLATHVSNHVGTHVSNHVVHSEVIRKNTGGPASTPHPSGFYLGKSASAFSFIAS